MLGWIVGSLIGDAREARYDYWEREHRRLAAEADVPWAPGNKKWHKQRAQELTARLAARTS
jgi:hypothetical protein